MALITSVAAVCDHVLHTSGDVGMLLQDFVLGLSETDPAVALRVGGKRLLSLWLDVATWKGKSVKNFSGAAICVALERHGAVFMARAVESGVLNRVWTSAANCAIMWDNVDLLDLLVSGVPRLKIPTGYEVAARAGNWTMFEWLYKHKLGGKMTTNVFKYVGLSGNVSIAEWIFDVFKVPLPRNITSQYGYGDFWPLILNATKRGHVELLKSVKDRLPLIYCRTTLESALVNDQYECAEWWYDQYTEQLEWAKQQTLPHYTFIETEKAKRDALVKGDLKKVEWLRQRGLLDMNSYDVDQAKIYGHVHVLDYVELHYPAQAPHWTKLDDATAIGGSIEVAEWSLSRNRVVTCRTNVDYISTAARYGHLEFLKWITHQERIGYCRTPSYSAAAYAALNGHLECLQFVVDKGFSEVTDEAVSKACVNGHLDVVQWIATSVHIFPTQQAVAVAGGRGYLSILQWLHANGKACDEQTFLAASRGRVPVLHWMLNTIPGIIDVELIQQGLRVAVESNSLEVVQYLYPHVASDAVFVNELTRLTNQMYRPHISEWLNSITNT